ncbi:MAG: methyltransferase domain-containing protein [Xanthomonadales bacterium]|nr:methyltransferase domain-containing protein [Xanthomonadales bacterium]
MNWRLKAAIQNAIALLPGAMSQRVYYAMQRRFGGLRSPAVEDKLRQGVEVAERVEANGATVDGARVLEVGTGRRLGLPLSLWLQGAERVTTVDLNPYLRAELVHEDLVQMRAQRDRVESLLGERLDRRRLDALLELAGAFSLPALLDLCAIRYASPADAASLELADASIDLHVSYEVMEHIPGPVLAAILREAARLLRPGGLAVHCIDLTDHFSHSDPGIGPLNFLRFGERGFRLLAGNGFMYMNRLQVDDYDAIWAHTGLAVRERLAEPDPDVGAALAAGAIPLAPRFSGKPVEVLAVLRAWYVGAAGGDRP